MAQKVTWGGWDSGPPEVRWLINGVLAAESVNVLVARPGSLKTWIAHSWAISVATGMPWLGRFPVKQGKALLLDYESGEYETKRRIHLLAKDRVARCNDLGYVWPSVPLHDPGLWKWISTLGVSFVAIDSLAQGQPGADENRPEFATPLYLAGSMAELHGTTTVFVHHARKSNSGTVEDSRDTVRGTGAVLAACETAYRVYNMSESTANLVCIKQGIGRTPAPVQVRLTDTHGLTYMEHA